MLLEELIEKEKYYKSECKNKDEEYEKKVEKGRLLPLVCVKKQWKAQEKL